jgi:hypothetical protein
MRQAVVAAAPEDAYFVILQTLNFVVIEQALNCLLADGSHKRATMAKFEVSTGPRLSRRTLLIGGIALGAGGTLAAASQAATPKVSQACVGFSDSPRDGHKCGNCRLFRPPSSCLDVVGVITENCSCKIWLPKIA